MKKKKIFQSKSLNRLVLLNRLVWLIPVVFFIYNVSWLGRARLIEILEQGYSFGIVFALVIMYAFVAIFQSLVPFLILKILLHYAKKQMIKNSTFQTVQDFDYYRDKLEGLSPGAISLISDLKLEQKKDVAASILRYKGMGILKETDGEFAAGNLKEAPLRKSDTYLIEGLTNHTFSVEYDKKWQQLVKQEAIEDGYIVQRTDIAKKGCQGCCLGAVIRIILIIAIFVFCYYFLSGMEEFERDVMNKIPEGASFKEIIDCFTQNPQYYFTIDGIFIMCFLLIGVIYYPVLFVAGMIGTAINLKWIKRTDIGNEMAECIYGMKNFIHDYSNLSEAEQEQIVLWDDYLVYAVVLEENQRIIDDIIKRRKKL